MATPGAIAWLDFRKDDLARAREFIRSMQDEGVLDELGFLSLQGAFADLFYPATSTLMSSARYLYFVAAIYRGLEQDGVSAARVDREARRRMDELRDVLSKNEGSGVIGREARLDIQRPPSSVYWNSLRLLGLFGCQLSEAGYQARFDDLHRAGRAFLDDDKAAQPKGGSSLWDEELPSPAFLSGGKFRPATGFRLHRSEAIDLARRFELRFPGSLLAHLLRIGKSGFDQPWLVSRQPKDLEPYLAQAEALSLFAMGTTLQYSALVVEERRRLDLPVKPLDLAGAFERWWREGRRVLRTWDPSQLERLPAVAPALRRVGGADLPFFSAWQARLLHCGSPTALLEDQEARRLVRKRELDIKPVKARLKNRKHLEQWNLGSLSPGPYLLTYRHAIGQAFAREILAGLEAAE